MIAAIVQRVAVIQDWQEGSPILVDINHIDVKFVDTARQLKEI